MRLLLPLAAACLGGLLAGGAPLRGDDPPDDFAEPLSPLPPAAQRTEAEQDRVLSEAQFAYGRLLLQREDQAGALRQFQRAWRNDPGSVTLLREIVPLAFELGRSAEAVRYAVLAAERDPRDPELLRQLAIHVSQEGERARALALYEHALRLRPERDALGVLTRVEIGRLSLLEGDFARSAEVLAEVRDVLADPAAEADPKLREALLGQAPEKLYVLLGEAFLGAGRTADADAAFRRANELKPQPGLLDLRLARVAFAADRPEEARGRLDAYWQAGELTASDQACELLEKLVAREAPEPAEARRRIIETLLPLREADPGAAGLGYFLAEQLADADRLDEALALYDDLLAISPAPEGVLGRLDVLRRQGDAPRLLDALADAFAKLGSLRGLGEEGERLLADEDLAAHVLAEAARRREAGGLTGAAAWAAAHLALHAGQADQADVQFAAALADPPLPASELLPTWGVELFAHDEYDRAAAVFQRALDERISPDNDGGYYFFLAGALEFAGRTDEALAAAEKAAELDSDSPRTRSRQAFILYHAKRTADAARAYEELLTKYGGDYESEEARETCREARLVLSALCVDRGELPQAEEWLEQVLDEFPEDPGAHNDLGYLWADQGKRLERALAMTARAVQAEPENAAYRDSHGWALFRLGRFAEALSELEQAAADDDPGGVILEHLGDCLEALGRREAALAAWRRAAEAYRSADEAAEARLVDEKIERHQS